MAKFAALDLGSNTLLLLIVNDESGQLVPLVEECEFGRLSQGLSTSQSLHPEAMARSLAILEGYRRLMDEHELAGVAAVGTQALREALNSRDFVAPAEALLGCSIEIIAGEREAELVGRAVTESFPDLSREGAIVVDVGGASTEFIHLQDGRIQSVKSLPIGAVRLSERFLNDEPASDASQQALYAAIDDAMDALDLPSGISIVGSAGTATSIASIRLQLASYEPERVHGAEFTPAQVAETCESLLAMSVAAKRELVGLEPKRADVVAGGVAIYARAIERFSAPRMVISDRGVRWGLAHELAAR